MLTLFDLVLRSMKKNIRHYYLYFFALIFSVALYFVFATLQFDAAVVQEREASMKFRSGFKAASILLMVISGIFVIYANAIFLKRRSREIGLYQLIGLMKGAVVRLLIIENVLMGAGALLFGVTAGAVISRLFLLLLAKLVGYDGFISLSFSTEAAIQTVLVFTALIVLTSIQMTVVVYRNSLLSLFNADQKGEHPKKPNSLRSALLAIIGIGMIVGGYWYSGRMINSYIYFNMLAVLFLTIVGTYLFFRVTISWVFFQIRKRKKGHLGLTNSLSIAALMHRLKGNANSLTVITVLSAMTLTMVAGSYSLYYSTETETRMMMPYDYMLTDRGEDARKLANELEENNIPFTHAHLEMLKVIEQFDDSRLPPRMNDGGSEVYAISDAQLREAGIDVPTPKTDSAYYYDMTMRYLLEQFDLPVRFKLISGEKEHELNLEKLGDGNLLNWGIVQSVIVVNSEKHDQLKKDAGESSNFTNFDVFMIKDQNQYQKASTIFQQYGTDSGRDYYSAYVEKMQSNGLLIFVAGFLGLVFLISTGSILYFKQMTEAEQERQGYTTLHRLGFTTEEIMKGIVRKQSFVFGVPLAIGLLHSIFAVKAASFIFLSDITIPAALAMDVYTLIYLIYWLLTIGYYKKIIKAAL